MIPETNTFGVAIRKSHWHLKDVIFTFICHANY